MAQKYLKITARHDQFRLTKPFVISRGSRTEANVVSVEITDGTHIGKGECTPYPRYGETVEGVMQGIEKDIAGFLEDTASITAQDVRLKLQEAIPAGAIRNATDCALWDLEAKQTDKNIAELLGISWPENVPSVETISIGSLDEMAKDAVRLQNFPVIKVKMNDENIIASIETVHKNAPHCDIIIDANESWTLDILNEVADQLIPFKVKMIEQPLPAADDAILKGYKGNIPLGADESMHTRDSLNILKGIYKTVNVKLDKTGGLTEALALIKAAKTQGFQIMVGSMIASSLGIAPAMFLSQSAHYVDLDSPSLLGEDRENNLSLSDGVLSPLNPKLWGGAN